MQTRKFVLSLAAVLVLALVAPVVGQPFADVPTNHWAYDAIAELAAKGLVEGFPDGTFKGNQPMTRYEMAMIVARIIARIEAIPTPPPPEVRRADLDAVRRDLTATRTQVTANQRTIATLQRLVNEFRAELQALGVRVTALEEELSALRARLDNTRITGDFHWRYTTVWGSAAGLPIPPSAEMTRTRLTFVGTVAPDLRVTLRARFWANASSPLASLGPLSETVNLDLLYFDWSNALGVEGLAVRGGRQFVTLGPLGLLLDEAARGQRRDGVSARWRLGGVDLLVAGQWGSSTGVPTYSLYSGRLGFALLPGWNLGLNVRVDHDPWVAANQGTGFSGDLAVELLSGLRLTGEYATYNAPNAPAETTRNFFVARLDLNFNQLSGSEIALSPRLAVWYKNLDDVAGTPLSGFPGGQYFQFQDAYFGNAWAGLGVPGGHTSFGARLDLNLLENLTGFVTYETYDGRATGVLAKLFDNANVWSVGASWTVAPRTTVNLFYSTFNISTAGVSTDWQAAGAYILTSW